MPTCNKQSDAIHMTTLLLQEMPHNETKVIVPK